MGAVLGPLVVMAIDWCTTSRGTTRYYLYALVTAIVGIFTWSRVELQEFPRNSWHLVGSGLLVIGIVQQLVGNFRLWPTAFFFGILLVSSLASLSHFPSLHSVFTLGEWILVCQACALLTSEWIILCVLPGQPSFELSQMVAVTGVIGCSVSCAMASNGRSKSISLPFRLAILVALPLLFVEASLYVVHWSPRNPIFAFPLSLQWLAHFLLATESTGGASFLHTTMGMSAITWPRYYWILYWVVVLLITLPLSPVTSSSSSRTALVVARKWFHGIAILLFVPVTAAAPKLQSLAYAIALAALCALECVRDEFPALNTFYCRYLDSSKDVVVGGDSVLPKDKQPQPIIISHMTLIAGCAVPLWITETIPNNFDPSYRLLVSLWGVVSLGVGDTMGALVGTKFGHIRWGARRTVEGSLAMLTSVTFASYLILGSEAFIQNLWPVALTAIFVTLLEAFTTQIDNLVLPLAGAVVLLLTIEQGL